MLKRIAVLVVAAIGLTAGPAAAQQYPPDTNLVTVSDTTPCPGGPATVTAQTFTAGSGVSVTLDGTEVATPTAGTDGKISVDLTIPTTTATGQHVVAASGTGSTGEPMELKVDINVVSCNQAHATTAAPSGTLPRTGSDSTMTMVRVGLALAAFGGVLLAVAAKRRRRAAALA